MQGCWQHQTRASTTDEAQTHGKQQGTKLEAHRRLRQPQRHWTHDPWSAAKVTALLQHSPRPLPEIWGLRERGQMSTAWDGSDGSFIAYEWWENTWAAPLGSAPPFFRNWLQGLNLNAGSERKKKVGGKQPFQCEQSLGSVSGKDGPLSSLLSATILGRNQAVNRDNMERALVEPIGAAHPVLSSLEVGSWKQSQTISF